MRQSRIRFGAITLLLILLVAVVTEAADQKTVMDESLRRGENRTTLDPGLFKDPRVKAAYQVAKDIPWVLDSIYCYCYCKESPVFKHKSVLSCYVDNHAAM